MTSRDELYGILEIGRTASVNEIKRAFRKLARRYHPDVNPGDRHAEERFKRMTEAYEILSDPVKREFYDLNGFYTEGVLEQHGSRTAWDFSFQGFDFSHSTASHFGEIFTQIFQRQTLRREPERGQDVEHHISISFEDSIRGLKTTIRVQRQRSCGICDGCGREPGSRESACMTCQGLGKTTKSKGHLQFAVACKVCGGTGRTSIPCPECAGEGRLPGTEVLDVELPPGIATGSRVRIPGKGDAGRFGGPAGDLYVVTNVGTHPFFNRVGDNIHCTIPLTVTEAALGTKVGVPTIDGPATVRIPPGTQTGQTFRLRGKGTPSLLHPGMRGDQYIEVEIRVPRIADERSKEILRELSRLNPENPRKDLWR